MSFFIAGMPLTKKGAFSYKQDTANFIAINNALTIKIERVNQDIGRVTLIDGQGQGVPVPVNLHMQQTDGAHNPVVADSFFITWVGSYVLYVDDEPYVELHNQKEQSISAPENAASWTCLNKMLESLQCSQ